MQEIGVNPDKILPWDWPFDGFLSDVKPRKINLNVKGIKIFYAGSLTENKGVGDLIDAVALLDTRGVSVWLKIAGDGEMNRFKQQSEKLNIEDRVEFLGLVSTSYVADAMREADVVAVPSRREYPEGFPKTINEALSARTPLVVSDHPVFQSRLKHRSSAMIFKSGEVDDLADCIEELRKRPELYSSLSESAHEVLESLQIPLKWGDLIWDWVNES